MRRESSMIFVRRLAGDGGELVEVHACAEGFSGAGEDADAGRVTFFDGVEGGLHSAIICGEMALRFSGRLSVSGGEFAWKFELQSFET